MRIRFCSSKYLISVFYNFNQSIFNIYNWDWSCGEKLMMLFQFSYSSLRTWLWLIVFSKCEPMEGVFLEMKKESVVGISDYKWPCLHGYVYEVKQWRGVVTLWFEGGSYHWFGGRCFFFFTMWKMNWIRGILDINILFKQIFNKKLEKGLKYLFSCFLREGRVYFKIRGEGSVISESLRGGECILL